MQGYYWYLYSYNFLLVLLLMLDWIKNNGKCIPTAFAQVYYTHLIDLDSKIWKSFQSKSNNHESHN